MYIAFEMWSGVVSTENRCGELSSNSDWGSAYPLPRANVLHNVYAALWVVDYFQSYRRNVASLSLPYRNFHGKYSDELRSSVPPAQTVMARTRHATYTGLNYRHSFRIPLVSRKFHSHSFFPKTATLWDILPRGYVLNHYSPGHDNL